ncbi:MAG: hypothetical protein OIF50_13475 [Flavobacteriaceae bacterium]|nr:hypothetical protein [Flavobacteriaceae bacterium]
MFEIRYGWIEGGQGMGGNTPQPPVVDANGRSYLLLGARSMGESPVPND